MARWVNLELRQLLLWFAPLFVLITKTKKVYVTPYNPFLQACCIQLRWQLQASRFPVPENASRWTHRARPGSGSMWIAMRPKPLPVSEDVSKVVVTVVTLKNFLYWLPYSYFFNLFFSNFRELHGPLLPHWYIHGGRYREYFYLEVTTLEVAAEAISLKAYNETVYNIIEARKPSDLLTRISLFFQHPLRLLALRCCWQANFR